MGISIPSEPRIFVSYNRKDLAFTQRLVKSLEHAGATVWVDWEGARDGDFLKRINQGLMKCDWLVLVETPNSLVSAPVELEVNAALNRALYGQMRGVVRLVAANRDPHTVPPTWATLQYYDATTNYAVAVDALFAAICAGDQRQASRHSIEHPGGQIFRVPVTNSTAGTPVERFLNRMATASTESDWQTVVYVADLLLAEHPESVTTDFYRMLGRALLELNRPSDAAQALRKAYERDSADIPTIRAAARAALRAGDAASADPLLKRALALAEDPDERLDILREYVPILQTLNNLNDALNGVDQALRLGSNDIVWLSMRRDLLTMLRRHAEALSVAHMVADRPEAAIADWMSLVRLARITGNFDDAVHTIVHAQQLWPEAPELTEERKALLVVMEIARERAARAGHWAEALRTLEMEQQVISDDVSRVILQIDLLHRLKCDGDAVTLVHTLLAQQTDAWTADDCISLARMCLLLDQPSAGWAALARARLMDSKRSGSYYSEALTISSKLAALHDAPLQSRLDTARQLVASHRAQDAWNLLNLPTDSAAKDAQVRQVLFELFLLPNSPARIRIDQLDLFSLLLEIDHAWITSRSEVEMLLLLVRSVNKTMEMLSEIFAASDITLPQDILAVLLEREGIIRVGNYVFVILDNRIIEDDFATYCRKVFDKRWRVADYALSPLFLEYRDQLMGALKTIWGYVISLDSDPHSRAQTQEAVEALYTSIDCR